eukprot:888906-Pyramimonas_sp.AAC.1
MSNQGFLIGQKGVKYGLTLNAKKTKQSNKSNKVSSKKPIAAFALSDSDEEKEDFRGAAEIARHQAHYDVNNARVRFQPYKPHHGVTPKSLRVTHVKAQHDAALAEDPTAFDYDGVYDDIKESQKEPKQAEKLERKSRYISGLLSKAKEREREQNVRARCTSH